MNYYVLATSIGNGLTSDVSIAVVHYNKMNLRYLLKELN